MFSKSRIRKAAIALASMFAIGAPVATAMPIDAGPVQSTGAHSHVVGAYGGSDAAQVSANDGVVVPYTSTRSDAAQRTPGETNAGDGLEPAPAPRTVSAPEGTNWSPIAIGALSAFVLAQLAFALTQLPRRRLGQTS